MIFHLKNHLAIAAAGVLLAFISIGLLGKSSVLSRFFAADYIAPAADAGFFLLSFTYCLLLWQMKQRISPRFFQIGFGCLLLLCLALLFC